MKTRASGIPTGAAADSLIVAGFPAQKKTPKSSKSKSRKKVKVVTCLAGPAKKRIRKRIKNCLSTSKQELLPTTSDDESQSEQKRSGKSRRLRASLSPTTSTLIDQQQVQLVSEAVNSHASGLIQVQSAKEVKEDICGLLVDSVTQTTPPLESTTQVRSITEVSNRNQSKDAKYGKAAWIMKSFFNYHGVVNQNINSFNKFLTSSMKDIIIENPIVVDCYTTEPFPVRLKLNFTEAYMDLPKRDEGDGHLPKPITPNECINRSLTYSSEIFAKGQVTKFEMQNGKWIQVPVSNTRGRQGRKSASSSSSTMYTGGAAPLPIYQDPFFFSLGKLPVMVRSKVCHLSNFKTEEEHHKYKECPLDPGGYFIINGKERVLVAQEKHPENRAVVYEVMRYSKFEHECEILSSIENSSRPVSAFWVRLLKDQKVPDLSKVVNFFQRLKDKRNVLHHPQLHEDEMEVDAEQATESQVQEEDGGNKIKTNDEEELLSMADKSAYACGKQMVIISPKLRKAVPLTVLLKAFGCHSPGEVMDFVLQGDRDAVVVYKITHLLQNSLDLWEEKLTQSAAIERIGSMAITLKPESTAAMRYDMGRNILSEFILPNIGLHPEDDPEKLKFICYMIRKICDVFYKWRRPDQRDDLKNKRFELAGTLFLQLFKRLWKHLAWDLQLGVKKRLDMGVEYSLKELVKPAIITKGFTYSLATGNWGDKKSGSVSSGISQELNRCSYVASLSHLRRVMTPTKLHRNVSARQLNLSNWGMLCPAETPEGEPVGLVQNFALSACISVGCSPAAVIEYLKEQGMTPLSNCNSESMKGVNASKVFVNGKWLGTHTDSHQLVHDLRALRRRCALNPEISIALLKAGRGEPTNSKKVKFEICVQTDAGRIYRPLIIVEGGKSKLTQEVANKLKSKLFNWETLLKEGIVELLDSAEITNTHIAMWEHDLEHETDGLPEGENAFTHCEIHPSMIFGLSASTIPFADHNQAPRNTYQSGMAKQAIGLYATNYQRRCDILAHLMHYPHRPLCSTFGAEMCKLWELPAGQECVVAILCHGGYNQEDSIIMNQSSIERGLLRSSVFHTYVDVENQISARREHDELFERPRTLEVKFLKVENYSHLEADGLPPKGTRIMEREVVIGKTSNCGGVKRDVSVTAKLNTRAMVSQAFVTTNEDGQRTHKVVLQETRCPKIGDKFASRHGQKGVIGMVYTQEDMPFTKDGIVPDIILNPHAIPSRMTIGHLVEALAGKAISMSKGNVRDEIDATAFSQPLTRDTFSKYLVESGFHKYGEEVMYDGVTGIKLQATVFMGINYYQRLRHMVDDKINIRNRGAVTQLEGQPKRGLTRDGAQRFGEMERDCTISHGAAGFLHERLFTVSDAAYFKVCNNCGNLVSLNPYVNQEATNVAGIFRCKLCDLKKLPSDNLSTIALPKAAKLLMQELMCMNIRPFFQVHDDFGRDSGCPMRKKGHRPEVDWQKFQPMLSEVGAKDKKNLYSSDYLRGLLL